MRYPPPTSFSPRRIFYSTFARKPASLVTRKTVRMASREKKAFDVFIENFPWADQAKKFRWFIDLPARELPGALTQSLADAADITGVTGNVSATVADQAVKRGIGGTVTSYFDLNIHDEDEEQVQRKLQDDRPVAKGRDAKDTLETLDWVITVTRPGKDNVLKKISLSEDTTRQTLPIDVQRMFLKCMLMAGSTGTVIISRSIVISQSTELMDGFPGAPKIISPTLSDTSPSVQVGYSSLMPPNGFLSISSNIFPGAPARGTIYTTLGTSSSEPISSESTKATSSTLSGNSLPRPLGGTGYASPEASVSSGLGYISLMPLGLTPATSSRRNSMAISQGISFKLSENSLDVPLITPGAVLSAPSQNILAMSRIISVLNGTSRLASLGYAPSTSMSGKQPATADAMLTHTVMDPTPSGSTTQGDVRVFGHYPENHTFGAGVGAAGTSWPEFVFRMDIPTLKQGIGLQTHNLRFTSFPKNCNTAGIEVEGFEAPSPSTLMTFSIPAAISGTGAPSSLKRKLEFADSDDSLPSGYMWPNITRRRWKDGRSACDACETAPRDMAKAFAVYCNHYIP